MSRCVAIFVVLLFAGLASAGSAPADGGTGGSPLAGTLTVRVVAAETTDPLEGAWVMVGPAEDTPFPGNTGLTDAAGEIVFSHGSLLPGLTVTAGAAGRAYLSFVSLGVSEVVLPLVPIEPAPSARVGDAFGGIEVNNGVACFGDGYFDVGFVLPALTVEQALYGGALDGFVVSEGPLSTTAGSTPIPDNIYVPAQCELLQGFSKLSYRLRVPTGERTLYGLSARIPFVTLLLYASTAELLIDLDPQEIDLFRDSEVTGDSDAFDFDAELALSTDLTVEVSNARAGTDVVAVAVGRITNDLGGEELILTGFDGYDPDEDGTEATLSLETPQATVELADLVHGLIVTQIADDAPSAGAGGATTSFVRSGIDPPAGLAAGAFFDIVRIDSPNDVDFSWSDVRGAGSPAQVHLNVSRIVHLRETDDVDAPGTTKIDRRTYWSLISPGTDRQLSLPALPGTAPTALPDPDATSEQDRLDFVHTVQRLGDDPDGFDYDDFSLGDTARFGTHTSIDHRPLGCDSRASVEGLRVDKGPAEGIVILTWSPTSDICKDSLSGRSYEVYAGDEPRPLVPPGDWPADPPYINVTDQDVDGSLEDETFTHLAPPGGVFYLVLDRGLSGAGGPSDHYGSYGPRAGRREGTPRSRNPDSRPGQDR